MLTLNNVIPAVALMLLLGFSCTNINDQKKQSTDNQEDNSNTRPKNIILLIGDGMGLSQVSSAFYFQDKTPNFMRFPQIGLIKTSSSKQKITDSAAGATAFATGKKTYNGAIGVDDNGKPLTSIVDIMSENDLSTGIISTSSITHATPACFYANAKQRNEEELIASQLHASEVDFFAGGGVRFFKNRSDNLNYLDSLQTNGFEVDTSGLKTDKLDFNNKYGFLLADEGMPKMMEGRGDFLPEATRKALNYLSKDEDGFFLMVEGSQIDWGGHGNDAEYVKTEVLDFDRAVGVALDFAEAHGNTQVVVTADHETGGYSLASDNGNYDKIVPAFSTGGHTATLIPVFAFGPGAESFGGIYDINEVFHKLTGSKEVLP